MGTPGGAVRRITASRPGVHSRKGICILTCYSRWPKGETRFKAAEEPRVVTRAKRKRAAEQSLEDAYALVDLRDKSICWVTGRHTHPKAVSASLRREHHHLKGRRVMPEWVHRPERILTVCAEAHQLITLGWIVVEGTDARRPVFFHYAPFVKPEQKTLVIKRKNVRPEAE